MFEFTYRTFNQSPGDYERKLADALFSIMGKSVHDLAEIVVGLNHAGSTTADGSTWTQEGFKAEMRRLGTWTNCIGAPVGTHGLPGISGRNHG